jgi:hypothetical protein
MDKYKLFVASIYAPSPWNHEWYRLQTKFLARNTQGVDLRFGIILNGVKQAELGADIDFIVKNDGNTGHSTAMSQLLEAFRQSDCTHFLFLDSDCFPVHRDWFAVLTAQMRQFDKHFAAPIRYENLDIFPHPCAFFCDRHGLLDERINFDIGHPGNNILGETVRDVGNAMLPMLPEILPLLRTNIENRHPVAAAIYHHMFYHHGAGSRNFEFRLLNKYDYCKHWWDTAGDEALASRIRDELFADSDAFLARLMGANFNGGQ